MKESYWKKVLLDGSIEFGSDSRIESREESWSSGRQDIASVVMEFAGRLIEISVAQRGEDSPIEWIQRDHWVTSPTSGKSTRVAREILFTTGGWPKALLEASRDRTSCVLGEEGNVPLGDAESVSISINRDGTLQFSVG